MLSTETAVQRCSSKQVYFRNIHRKKLKAWRLFASCCLWKVDSLWKLSLERLFALWKVPSRVKALLFYWCRSSYWRCFVYTCSNFFFASHSLPLFLSWFLISAFMGKGVGFTFLISPLWLGLSVYYYFILFWFFLSLTFFVSVCVNVSYHIIFFFIPSGKDQNSHFVHVILAYLIFVSYQF